MSTEITSAANEIHAATLTTATSTKPERTRAGSGSRRERLFALAPRQWPLAVALTVILGVQGWNITNYPSLSDDEGTYLAQAWAVRQGMGLSHYTFWYDHPPLAWIQIAAVSWLPELISPEGPAVAYGRLLMPVVTLSSALLLYLLARRLALPRWAAVLAVLLFGLSPISVSMHRQVYLDNIAVAWMLAAFVLALSPRRAFWVHVCAGLAGAVSVLSKETMILVTPGLVIALWQGSHPSTRKFSFVGFACSLVLISGLYPLYATLKGELFPGAGHVSLIGASLYQLRDRTSSGSIFTVGSDANDLLRSWLFHDTVLLVGGTLAVVLALAVPRLRAPALAGVVLVLVAMRPGGYLPAMYVIQALPFFALTLAGLAWVAVRMLVCPPFKTLWRWIGLAGTVVAALLATAAVVPRWIDGNHRALTASETSSYAEAAAWIRGNVTHPADTRIVVDNVLWLDLAIAGFEPGRGAIWFFKLDLDPAIVLPGGWRDLDYVVSSPVVRRDAERLPLVAAALANSEVVASFGSGDGRIDIRRVNQSKE